MALVLSGVLSSIHFAISLSRQTVQLMPSIVRFGGNLPWLRQMTKRYRSEQVNNARPTAADAKSWIQDNFSFIGQNPSKDEDLDLTLEEIINFAEISVVRFGTKVLVLDPWNEIEHRRKRDESETEYVNRALKEFKRFARRFDVLVIIVAHPTKMTQHGKVQVPTLYDINGSANWFNKADYGLVIWRDKVDRGTQTTVKISKIKEHDYMGKPGTVTLELDANSLTYYPEVQGSFGNLAA